jgi:hypothetical protein
MGRGAGNLKTELILTALNSKNGMEVDFNALEMLSALLMDYCQSMDGEQIYHI